MLDVEYVRVRTLDIRSMQIAWQVADTYEEVLDYQFRILRSEGPAGPWDELSDWFTDKFQFRDSAVEPFHLHRTMNYIIRVKHIKSGMTKDFGPYTADDQPDLIALEVRRHWDVKLRELMGRRSWFFPVRTFGTTCRNCYDNTQQVVTSSRCPSCYSTGFVRGFHHPIEIYAQFMPTPKNLNLGPEVRQESPNLVYMSAFPEAKPKDLIVSPDNRRWRVVSVKRTERLGCPLHQELTVAECARGDIEFDVPVNFQALMSAPLAEERNFRYRTTIG
ncbi:MAG: hypothetical protein GYA36_19220 [Veillonellaceae bacterium]|nr:hypothetical protein [Veillonellaceae bacterium]